MFNPYDGCLLLAVEAVSQAQVVATKQYYKLHAQAHAQAC